MGPRESPWVAPQRRGATSAELDQVLAIEAQSYSHPWTRVNFIDALQAGQDIQVLSDAEGAIVAYSVAMAGVDEWHLLNLTVAREHRRRGLGSVLLRGVIADARRSGKTGVWLEVRASNAAAIELYERHGFSRTGLRRGYYPAVVGREDAVLMTLSLLPPPAAGGC